MTFNHSRYINMAMRYKLLRINTDGPREYTLTIEEYPSLLDRLLSSKQPRIHVIRGDGIGFWEYPVHGINISRDLIDFANEVVKQHGDGICLRK